MSQLNKFTKIFFGLAIFTLPLQLNLLTYQAEWGRGFINPYTSIWFSITEFFLLISAILFFIHIKKEKKEIQIGHKIFFLLMIGMILISTASILISPFSDPTFHILLFAKLLELVLFYLLIVNKVLKPRNLLEIFIVSMSIQAVLAIFQVLSQHSLGLSILGEPYLAENVAHIARFTFGGIEVIRGYGTFSHPNILGGFLTVSLLCSLLFSPHLKHERKILILIQFLGLLSTFSRSALLAFMISVIIITFWYLHKIKNTKNRLIPLGLISLFTIELLFLAVSRGINILADPAFLERIEGYKAAINMFLAHPFGVGFQHFTLFLDESTNSALMPWDYQPVHNLFLLSLSEAGIIGFILATGITIFAIKKLHRKTKKLLSKERLFKKRIFLVIVISFFVISMFDHYLITIEQGRILLAIIFAIISAFLANPRHILPIRKGGDLKKILSVQE
jgi:O-antigen ligase